MTNKPPVAPPIIKEYAAELALQIEDAIEQKCIDVTTLTNTTLEVVRVPRTKKDLAETLGVIKFLIPLDWEGFKQATAEVFDWKANFAFQSAEAKEFYDQWRSEVLVQMVDWWAVLKHPQWKL